jgi:hypothetical protein
MKFFSSYRPETKIHDGHRNRISGSRIAPEIERNLLLCITIIPQRDKSVRGSFSQVIFRKPKFKMAATSRYPEVRSHQKSKGTFSSASAFYTQKIFNQ